MGMGLGWLSAATGAQEGLDTLLARRLKEQENQRRNKQLSDEEAQFAQQMELRNREFGAESENRRLTREEAARHNKVVEDYQADEKNSRAALLDQQKADREAAQRTKDAQQSYLDQQLARKDLPAHIRRAYEAYKVSGHMGSLEDPNAGLARQEQLIRLQDKLARERASAEDPQLPGRAQDFVLQIVSKHDNVQDAMGELSDNVAALRQAFPNLSVIKARDLLRGAYALPTGYSERMMGGMSGGNPFADGAPEGPAQSQAPAARPQSRIKSITQVK